MTGIFDPHCDCPKCRSRAAAQVKALEQTPVIEKLSRECATLLQGNANNWHVVQGFMIELLSAISVPAMPTPRVIEGEPVAYASAEQLAAMPPDRETDEGGHYIPLRRRPAGKFQMPLYTASPSLIAERDSWKAAFDHSDKIACGLGGKLQAAEAENAALKAKVGEAYEAAAKIAERFSNPNIADAIRRAALRQDGSNG